jgi:ElaA protein
VLLILILMQHRNQTHKRFFEVILWSCKPFLELGASELYALLRLRQEVFVLEQACPYLDADGLDPLAHHLCGWESQGEARALLAYARLFAPGQRYAEASIGRVITAMPIRGTGQGRLLMWRALSHCKQFYAEAGVRISAQARLEPFYRDFGFVTEGEPYDEDGIAHLAMTIPATRLQTLSVEPGHAASYH